MRTLPDLFKALADPTRLRILGILEKNELRVGELVQVLEMPQPTVSRHLGLLLREELLGRRRDGMWTLYSWNPGGPLSGNGLGTALREQLRRMPEARGDPQRIQECLEARGRESHDFFARVAPEWDRLREGLDVEGLHARLLGGLLGGDFRLVDAGTGTGALLPLLAPGAASLVGIDRSPEMLQLAGRRVRSERLRGVHLVRADLHDLPLSDASTDGVCSAFALHHMARPSVVVAEFGRIVRPGGRVVVSDLAAHDQEWMRTELAHVWLGFDASRIRTWFEQAGLIEIETVHLQRRGSPTGRPVPDIWVVRGRRPRTARGT